MKDASPPSPRPGASEHDRGRRRERERKSLRETILAEAEELFVAGPAEFSMRKLAHRIGYSATTIYLHFQDQDELLSELIELNFGRLLDAFRHLAEVEDPVEKLKALGRAYLHFGLENPHHYRFLFMLRPELDAERPTEGRLAQLAWRSLRNAVQAVLDEEKSRSVDPEIATYAFWAALHGLVSLAITCCSHLKRDEVEAIARLLIEQQVAGLTR